MPDEISQADIEAAIGAPLDEADRAVLRMCFDYFGPLMAQASEQLNDMARWLLASLLAVNAGGILAALNSEAISGQGETWACGFWLFGILLALATGFTSFNGGRLGIKIMSDMLTKIVLGLHSGLMPDLRFQAEADGIERRTRITIGVGLASGAAFIAGALAAAASVLT